MNVENQEPAAAGGCGGLLAGLGLIAAVTVLLLGETLGMIALLAHVLPDRAELRVLPLLAAATVTLVSFALLATLIRWAIVGGAIRHVPMRNGDLRDFTAAARRRRGIPVLPFGAGELAMLPVVWILPVIIVVVASGDPAYDHGRGTVNLLLGLLLVVPPVIAADRGAPRVILPGTTAWLVWATLFLHARPFTAAAAALACGTITWILAVRLPKGHPTPASPPSDGDAAV